MTDLTAEELAVLESGFIRRRDFVKMELVDPNDDEQTVAYWTGAGTIIFGGVTYVGTRVGVLGDMESVADLSIPTLNLILTGADEEVLARVMRWRVEGRPVEAFMGLWNTSTNALAGGTLRRIFKGFLGPPRLVNDSLGGFTALQIECQSHSRQLSRSYDEIRSDTSQRRRDPNDRSLKGVATAGRKKTNWDEKRNKPDHRRGDKRKDRR